MSHQTKVYQLRIRLKGISPMIWRRILVRDDSTIADLHHIIQIVMEWEDDYLHQFIIHGRAFGIYRSGGMIFLTNANEVFLKDFQFSTNERFLYEYNFFDHWEHEIRIEKLLPINPGIMYPRCIGGKLASPGDCGGPRTFMEQQDYYSPGQIEQELVSIICRRLNGEELSDSD